MNTPKKTPRPANTTPRAKAPPGPRAAAIEHLALLIARYPDLPLIEVAVRGLSVRDAALAHAIVDAAVRRWITLEFLIQSRLDRPMAEVETPLRAALLAGAAQMFFLDKVPPHAAIFETVEWVKRLKPSAGGFVNGVLRSLSRLLFGSLAAEGVPAKPRREAWGDARDELPLADGGALALGAMILPGDRAQRWSIATSHPLWLVRKWNADWGPDAAADLMRHDLVDDPPTVLNTAHAAEPLPAGCSPHAEAGCCVFTGSRESLTDVLASRADLWVQDAASTLAVRSAADLRPALVVDLCAGRGTKTRQLAAAFPGAEIVASDPDAGRSMDLRDAVARCPKARIVGHRALPDELRGRADLVLADVPCANSGVLPRRPEARYRCDKAQMDRLIGVQRTILSDARALLARGGTLLYSTCSVEKEENEEQAAWAAATLGLSLVSQVRTRPAGRPGGDRAAYHDGSYSALLRA